MRIEATYDLMIDLIPGEGEEDPALFLWSRSDEDGSDQGLIIMLDEIEELRAALAEAAAKLAEMGSQGIR